MPFSVGRLKPLKEKGPTAEDVDTYIVPSKAHRGYLYVWQWQLTRRSAVLASTTTKNCCIPAPLHGRWCPSPQCSHTPTANSRQNTPQNSLVFRIRSRGPYTRVLCFVFGLVSIAGLTRTPFTLSSAQPFSPKSPSGAGVGAGGVGAGGVGAGAFPTW